MPLPRFQRLDPEKRAQLLRIAAKQFAEKGYEVASLNDILAEAGFGKSSYYYYFEDKEDLFATVVEDLLARIAADTEPPDLAGLTRRTFWPAAEAWAMRSVEVLGRHPELVPLGRQLQAQWKAPAARFRELVTKATAETRAALEVGRRLGCVRDDVDLDWLVSIARAADQAVDERFFNGWSHDVREHARIAFDTFRRLVEARR